MRNYRLSKEVPWKEILRIVRWHLKSQVSQYQHICRIINSESAPGLSRERDRVRESLQAYCALREFLGYYTKPVLADEVEEALKDHSTK